VSLFWAAGASLAVLQDGIALVSYVCKGKAPMSLVVLSSENPVVAESQWMSPGLEEGLAFLLNYTGVCVFGGVALAAGVPLLGGGGSMCS
jgi:hypothetical protein